MVMYYHMINRLVTPIIKRHEARGRAETNQAWEEWNQRRMDAEANNLPFDEPPPSQR